MSQPIDFRSAFHGLTGYDPFPWQEAIYARFLKGDFPSSCHLPTGLGKTSIIAIWLIALANAPEKVPRRLVYIVNRRTVVDQATDEAKKLCWRLMKLEREGVNPSDAATLAQLGIALCKLSSLSGDEKAGPLAISTLRGQFADNSEWRADPARPAVLCGTIDMIGSRLLFSGYGCGFKTRPLHAGFLGQDSLLVHDEAHLEEPFQRLLETIEKEQTGSRTPDYNPMRVMALSATTRSESDNAVGKPDDEFRLTPEERNPPAVLPVEPSKPLHSVWLRLRAKKSLRFHSAGAEKGAVAEKIAEIASEYKDKQVAVLVYARTLDDVHIVQKELEKTRQVVLLTGTMRGKERDELTETDGFKRFLKDARAGETVYMVCTSAGEVGVDMSAQHLVCDLAPFDSMAQRFGRVNRYGDGNALIDVVRPESYDEKDKLSAVREKTFLLLNELPELPERKGERCARRRDACPKALGDLRERTDLPCKIDDAFTPSPTVLPATDILFDAWALTTIRERLPGRPPVEPYLHGIAEWEPPQTCVAWRKEVDVVKGELLDQYPPADLLEEFPLKPRELLRDRSDRVFDELQVLAGKHPDRLVWVVDEQGTVIPSTLAKLADPSATQATAKKPLIERIKDHTVLLPPIVGGLSGGMLDGNSSDADDVADMTDNETPTAERRLRLFSDDEHYDARTRDMRLVRSIELSPEDDAEEPRAWDWYKFRLPEDSRTAQRPVRLDVHTGDVVQQANRIVAGLSLPEEIAQAVRIAARRHDCGKRRRQFQLSLGNPGSSEPLAKSGRVGARLPEPYRHEFGSLADVRQDEEFQRLSPEMQDLALHLIAAHHGRARPCFARGEAFDPDRPQCEADAMAADVVRRFARLQRTYGRWGLAYFESLLRAADWAASAKPSKFVTETSEAQR